MLVDKMKGQAWMFPIRLSRPLLFATVLSIVTLAVVACGDDDATLDGQSPTPITEPSSTSQPVPTSPTATSDSALSATVTPQPSPTATPAITPVPTTPSPTRTATPTPVPLTTSEAVEAFIAAKNGGDIGTMASLYADTVRYRFGPTTPEEDTAFQVFEGKDNLLDDDRDSLRTNPSVTFLSEIAVDGSTLTAHFVIDYVALQGLTLNPFSGDSTFVVENGKISSIEFLLDRDTQVKLGVVPPPTAPDALVGEWDGTLTVSQTELAITVDFQLAEQGLTATIDIPQQGVADLPLANVQFDDPVITFELTELSSTFEGQYSGDAIDGGFSQAGTSGTFALTRVPPAPLPYQAQEVVYQNGDIDLAGTLTLPSTTGTYPTVVLVTGSGPLNRDSDIFGFPVFGILADHLTRNGIAVLRSDDRGVGGSTGDVTLANLEDYAGDVVAAIEFLKTHPNVDGSQIGLIGHSQGALVSAIASATSSDVAFVVMLAGQTLGYPELLESQVEAILRAEGAPEEFVQAEIALQRAVNMAVTTGEGWDEVEVLLAERIRAQISALSDAQRALLGDVDNFVAQVTQENLVILQSPLFKFQMEYDPVPVLEQLDIPVLALFGELDTQVLPELGRLALDQAIDTFGNDDYTTVTFPGANHLFQQAETGAISEYAALEPQFISGFLDTVTGWLLARVTLAAPSTE